MLAGLVVDVPDALRRVGTGVGWSKPNFLVKFALIGREVMPEVHNDSFYIRIVDMDFVKRCRVQTQLVYGPLEAIPKVAPSLNVDFKVLIENNGAKPGTDVAIVIVADSIYGRPSAERDTSLITLRWVEGRSGLFRGRFNWPDQEKFDVRSVASPEVKNAPQVPQRVSAIEMLELENTLAGSAHLYHYGLLMEWPSDISGTFPLHFAIIERAGNPSQSYTGTCGYSGLTRGPPPLASLPVKTIWMTVLDGKPVNYRTP